MCVRVRVCVGALVRSAPKISPCTQKTPLVETRTIYKGRTLPPINLYLIFPHDPHPSPFSISLTGLKRPSIDLLVLNYYLTDLLNLQIIRQEWILIIKNWFIIALLKNRKNGIFLKIITVRWCRYFYESKKKFFFFKKLCFLYVCYFCIS